MNPLSIYKQLKIIFERQLKMSTFSNRFLNSRCIVYREMSFKMPYVKSDVHKFVYCRMFLVVLIRDIVNH